MEVSQQLRCFSSKPSLPSYPAAERTSTTASFSAGVPTTTRRRRASLTGVKTEFRDLGHLEYYHIPNPKTRLCVTAKKKKNDKETEQNKVTDSNNKKNNKNKLKLLKALSQNVSMFSDMSRLQDDHVSEAANVLLKQLEKLRAEEEELKERRKQDKAEQMATMIDNDSTSEFSESSDSDCGEVIYMNRLRSQPAQHFDNSQSAAAQVAAAVLAASLPSLPTTNATEKERGGYEDITSLQLQQQDKESECRPTTSNCCSKRVEVCMGNKCKKYGGAALMEEFERQMGGNRGAVVGCKCMGKCRSAPNVRFMNSALTDDVCVRTTNNNPLCIGVGLEDVSAIVASLLGEDAKDFGLAVREGAFCGN